MATKTLTYAKANLLVNENGAVSDVYFGKKLAPKQVKNLRWWANSLKYYEQTTSKLVSFDDEFCCLGVYCDMNALKGNGCWVDVNEVPFRYSEWQFHDKNGKGGTSTLPDSLLKELMTVDEQDLFVQMNDDYQMSFDQISAFIQHWINKGFTCMRGDEIDKAQSI